MDYSNRQALNQYRQVSVQGTVTDTNPHAVIQLLMQGCLERIARAKSALERGDLGLKADLVTQSLRIVDGLRAHLDHERGKEIAANLDALYEYMGRRLIEANTHNDAGALDEVRNLLGEIKAGWDAIAPAAAASAAGR